MYKFINRTNYMLYINHLNGRMYLYKIFICMIAFSLFIVLPINYYADILPINSTNKNITAGIFFLLLIIHFITQYFNDQYDRENIKQRFIIDRIDN